MKKITNLFLIGMLLVLVGFLYSYMTQNKTPNSIQIDENDRKVALPINSEKEAIAGALKTPEVQEILDNLSKGNKGYKFTEYSEAQNVDPVSGTFYGYMIEETGKHWHVIVIYLGTKNDMISKLALTF